MLYDTAKSYVEFGQPSVWGDQGELYLDSLSFSFATQSTDQDVAVIKLPIRIIGQNKSYDRAYKVNVIRNETTLDLDYVHISKAIVHSGLFMDTLEVVIEKYNELKNGVFTLSLGLEANEQFDLGKFQSTRCAFTITNQLFEPLWWSNWRYDFGSYKREVYEQWIRIYQPGLDPTPAYFATDKPNFSWANMPSYAVEGLYPVTFMYIELLKKYFEDHVVYPNGDPSQQRIQLP